MNVTAYQEKEKNKETKTGKRRAGEKRKRKRATDFKKAVSCPSAVVQGAAGTRVTGTLRKSNSHFDPTQTGLGTLPPR